MSMKGDRALSELLAHQLSLIEQSVVCHKTIVNRLGVSLSVESSTNMSTKIVDKLTSPKSKGVDMTSSAKGSLNIELKRLLIDREDAAGSKGKVPFPESKGVLETSATKGSLDTYLSEPSTGREHGDCVEAVITMVPSVLESPSFDPPTSLLCVPSVAEMKERIDRVVKGRNIWGEPYKHSGFWQSLVKHPAFQRLTTVMIIANLLWLPYEVDYYRGFEASSSYKVVESLFCLYFVVDIVARFMAMKSVRHAFHNSWFLFDGMLVLLMIWTTWIQGMAYLTMDSANSILSIWMYVTGMKADVFRVFRLLRVCGMAKVARSLPELHVIYKGMLMALRSGVSILVALVGIVYVFAILFTTSLRDDPVAANAFETVPQAMHFLLSKVLNGGIDVVFLGKLLDTSFLYYLWYLTFHFLCNITIMSMLGAVLVGVVKVVVDQEAEEVYLTETYRKVGTLLKDLDDDGSGGISKDEFFDLMNKEKMIIALHEQNVDVLSLMDLGIFLYRDLPEVTIADILALITQLRGTKHATVKDLVDLRKFLALEVRAALRAGNDR